MFLQDRLSNALDKGQNIWKEMRKHGLLPKRKEAELHGFAPRELNEHFAAVSISPHENIDYAMDTILSAPQEGFTFKPANFNDVALAISHFSSQARGVDGIPPGVIVKALPIIGGHVVKIFLCAGSSRASRSKHRG